MKIQVTTVTYKEYFIDTDVDEIKTYDDIDGLIEWYVERGWRKESTSKEIIADKRVTPDNQEDYDYINGEDISLDPFYKEQEELDELKSIYEKGLGLEDERVAF